MRRPAAILCVLVLALLAAGVAVSGTAHRSPCHLSHSCPSDHHSYTWLDAAGKGWDCAKVGAPEVNKITRLRQILRTIDALLQMAEMQREAKP